MKSFLETSKWVNAQDKEKLADLLRGCRVKYTQFQELRFVELNPMLFTIYSTTYIITAYKSLNLGIPILRHGEKRK